MHLRTPKPPKLYRAFMNLKISHKLLLGYIIVILIPTFFLEYTLYNQKYQFVLNRYIQNEKSALDMAQKNTKIQLNKIQESADFLNSNSILNFYLNGFYNTQSEELYYYIKDIQPLLDYFLSSDTAIQNITFYSDSSFHLNWSGRLVHTTESPLPEDVEITMKDLIEGFWYKKPGDNSTLTFYQGLYNSNYSRSSAILCVNVSLASIMKNFSSLSGTVYARFSNDSRPLQLQGTALTSVSESILTNIENDIRFSETSLLNQNLQIYLQSDIATSLNYNGMDLLVLLLFLFLLLTIGYYAIALSITRRITRLQKHISQSEADNLVPLEERQYNDEVGQLTVTYNQMIKRINNLLYQIYHTEMEKKDAEFYALQAQIKPHFLYNILENIHMSAKQSGDGKTASMVTSLGKFMRYNLNSNTGVVHLAEELLHVRNFLDIHKIRMGERLVTEISVYTEIDDILCPRFILQPLLENAISHAQVFGGQLIITVSVKDRFPDRPDSDIVLEICDNGAPIPPEVLHNLTESLNHTTYSRDAHIGLNSINNRMQAFFGSDYKLHIDSKPNTGTCVTLFLKRAGESKNENFDCRR